MPIHLIRRQAARPAPARLAAVLAGGALAALSLAWCSSAPPVVEGQDGVSFVGDVHVRGGRIWALERVERWLYAPVGDRLWVIELGTDGSISGRSAVLPSGADGAQITMQARDGRQLLVSDYARLWRFSLEEPARPAERDRLDVTGRIVGLEDGRAYVASDTRLTLLSAAPERDMAVLASHAVTDVLDVVLVGAGRLALLRGDRRMSRLEVVDARDPERLVTLGAVEMGGTSGLLGAPGAAYVEVRGGGCSAPLCLDVVDLADPSQPRVARRYSTSLVRSADTLGALWDRGLLALSDSGGSSTGLEWVDVSDPLRPRAVSVQDLRGVYRLQALVDTPEGPILASAAGLHAVEMGDPAAPGDPETLPWLGSPQAACPTEGGWLVVGEQGGYWLLAEGGEPPLALRGRIELEDRLNAWNPVPAVACAEERAFAVSRLDEGESSSRGTMELHVADVSDPAHPEIARLSFPHPGPVSNVVSTARGLATLETGVLTSDPLLLRLWELTPAGGPPTEMAERGRLALGFEDDVPLVVSASAEGDRLAVAVDREVFLVDISRPEQPVLLWHLAQDERVYGLDLQGGWIATMDGSGALGLFDAERGRLLWRTPIPTGRDGGEVVAGSVLLQGDRALVSGLVQVPISPDDPWMRRSESRLWLARLDEPWRPAWSHVPAPVAGSIAVSRDRGRLGISSDRLSATGFAEVQLTLPPPVPLGAPWSRIWLPLALR